MSANQRKHTHTHIHTRSHTTSVVKARGALSANQRKHTDTYIHAHAQRQKPPSLNARGSLSANQRKHTHTHAQRNSHILTHTYNNRSSNPLRHEVPYLPISASAAMHHITPGTCRICGKTPQKTFPTAGHPFRVRNATCLTTKAGN